MMKSNSKAGSKPDINKTELLFRIAKAMAAVEDGRELLKIIVDETQPIFGFCDIGLAVLDKSGEFYLDWAVFYAEINPSELNRTLRADNIFRFSVDEPLFKYAFARAEKEKKPFISNMTTEFIEEFKDFPHLPLEIEHGYKQFLVTTLQFGGEILGLLTFNGLRENNFESCDFELFQAIADLVAVAVANILANEEILGREREKALLLSLSEDMATIRERDDLFKVILKKIKPIVGFDDAVISVYADDFKAYKHFVTASPPERQAHPLYQKIVGVYLPIAGNPDEYVLEQIREKGILRWDTEDMLEAYPGFYVAEFLRENSLLYNIYMKLSWAGKVIGFMNFHFSNAASIKESNYNLYKSIADQIAVAAANILANEEVKKQLVEITNLKKRLEAENKYLTEEVGKNYNFEEIIGTSPRLRQVFEIIETVAPTDATVLIQGETGTGKELIARAIHNRSTRNARPLIKINCAALPRELVESELFGHERGSFTGAHEKRLGKFELADKGTIFLDEIGELPLDAQVKLLRVLQEKEIERLGGKGIIKLDLRVVAATNRNLASEVQAGRFRADLYYRLCTVELFMPSLREREEDIEPLTLYFAQKYAAKFSRRIERISTQMLAELNAYDFPGNVRELEHIVEHAVIFSRDEKLILPRALVSHSDLTALAISRTTVENQLVKSPAVESKTLETIERAHIIEVLCQTLGRIKGKGGAAEILGLNPATLYFRMKKLGIEKVGLMRDSE